MSRLFSVLLASSLLSVPAAHAAGKAERTGEAALARTLGDRVAGAPVDCVDPRRIRSSRIIDGTAIVYNAGSTLYVNRPRAGAESLDDWDVLVTKIQGTRLCSTDVVQLHDRSSHMPSGLVFLGEFVPYKKVRSASAR